MLIFAKDISNRDFIHSAEDRDPDIKKYMDYQRCLFPYTIVRGGLDLAYKELDDILNYLDNSNQPPVDSNRQEYPSDIPDWYRARFPWTAGFIKIEDIMNLFFWICLSDILFLFLHPSPIVLIIAVCIETL